MVDDKTTNTMKDLQEKVQQLAQRYTLQKDPEIGALDLTSEVGELAKEIILTTDYGKTPSQPRKDIEKELGDVLFSLIILANIYTVDLEKALQGVLEKCEKRFQETGHIGSRT